jgi:hypothetical protein
MALTIKPPPALTAEPRTTYWVGDPAIDQDASDVVRWAETADPDALVIRPGATPTAIRWRALTGLELTAVIEGLPAIMQTPRRAFRIGLVSVDGYPLSRVTESDVRQISYSNLQDLTELKARFQVRSALNRWLELDPLAGRTFQPPFEPEDVFLPFWLGSVILASTFRGGQG